MRTMTSRSPSCTSVLGVLFVALLGISASSVSNSVGAGDAAHFLRSGIGARAVGMGGAFAAVASDVYAGYWNPAGLIQSTSVCVGGTYESRYDGLLEVQYLAGSFCSPTVGAGVIWAHSDIYSVYAFSGAVGLGGLTLGVSGKVYDFSATAERAGGAGFDVGGLFRTSLGGVNLAFAVTSADVAWSEIRWDEESYAARDYTAWVTRAGAVAGSQSPFGAWQIATDFEIALRRPPLQGESDYFSSVALCTLSVGVEFWVEWIAVRVGLADIGLNNSEAGTRATLGLGIQRGGMVIDVAWVPSQLGNTYILTMEERF